MKEKEKYWISHCEVIPIKTRDILNQYLLSLKLANKAEATIKKYRWILEKFLSECLVPLNNLSPDNVIQWLNNYSADKKPRTMDLFFSAFSSFFSFCLDEEYMTSLVIKKRWKPKIPQSLPKYLSQEEVVRVKRLAETLSLRNRALILLLFSTGCRVSEIVGLNRQDIDLKKRTAVVKGKGKKIRSVHFTEECAFVLNDYLQTRLDEDECLFLNKFGGRLKVSGIYAVTTKLGKKAELAQYLHPHIFRHTFATTMLSKGADLQFIADELGHDDLNTTRNYARTPSQDLIMAYQNIMGG